MKCYTTALLLGLALLAPPADAKVQPLTHKEAIAVLSAVAQRLHDTRHEQVVSGDCWNFRRTTADCGLILKRPGTHDRPGADDPDTCGLDVTVRKTAKGFFYRATYATGTHMAFICAPLP